MDFKGITWAGNIYQKFEEMCLEVEEVMYEDTAKYVENQVEKVGVSVKKFYEEIMQDLLPSDNQADINKKPKLDKRDIHRELDKKETREDNMSDPTAEEKSPLNACNDAIRFYPPSPRVPFENTCSEKSKKVGIHKRPIGIKRISKNNHPPKLSRGATSSSPSRDGTSNLLVFDMKSNYLVASADVNDTKPSQFSVRNDRGEAVPQHTTISDASVESFSSDQNLSAERKERNGTQSTSLMQKKDVSECNDLLTKPIETFRKDCSISQIKSIGNRTCEVESEGEEVIVPYEDNFNVEVIETEDDVEEVEKSKLEESCVLVELDCISPETKTHKSYKKKICEALASKLRPTGKQEQHVFPYKDLSLGDDGHHPCESEWELL